MNNVGKVAEDSDREGAQADGCVLDTGVSAAYEEIVNSIAERTAECQNDGLILTLIC